MTLLTVSNSEGTRRCDARCYDAKGPRCTCCCCGVNHGKGLQAALENNEQLLPEEARQYLKSQRIQFEFQF